MVFSCCMFVWGVEILMDYSIEEFLEKLATCDGDEALHLVSRFQSGAYKVEGFSVEDFEQ